MTRFANLTAIDFNSDGDLIKMSCRVNPDAVRVVVQTEITRNAKTCAIIHPATVIWLHGLGDQRLPVEEAIEEVERRLLAASGIELSVLYGRGGVS